MIQFFYPHAARADIPLIWFYCVIFVFPTRNAAYSENVVCLLRLPPNSSRHTTSCSRFVGQIFWPKSSWCLKSATFAHPHPLKQFFPRKYEAIFSVTLCSPGVWSEKGHNVSLKIRLPPVKSPCDFPFIHSVWHLSTSFVFLYMRMDDVDSQLQSHTRMSQNVSQTWEFKKKPRYFSVETMQAPPANIVSNSSNPFFYCVCLFSLGIS